VSSRARAVLILALAGLAGWPGAAAAAPARVIEPLDPAPGPARGFGDSFYRDRVIDSPPAAMAAVTKGLVTRRYALPGGGSVEITLSSSFPDIPENRAGAQSFARFMATRLHGPELSRLRVFIGTDIEVAAACGGAPGVLACYSRAQRRMYVPDRDPAGGGPFTREYAVTHEYGHHVAGHRSHYPFVALNFGAKYWSSYMHVCSRARRGVLFPGNQSTHYAEDPGEGFADTYAHLHYPSVIWQFAPVMRPNAGAFAAVRRDVRFPWRAPKRREVGGSLGSKAAHGFSVRQTLDGFLTFRLAGPRGANYDIELVNRGQVLRRTVAPGSRDVLTVLSCRGEDVPVANLVVRVVRRSGGGRFGLRASVVG
jgi:hypothetical protein